MNQHILTLDSETLGAADYSSIPLLNQDAPLNSHIQNPKLNSNVNLEVDTCEINKISETLSNLYKNYSTAKLHLFDSNGTIAIIELDNNIAWINDSRNPFKTDYSFDCELSSINALTKVNRKTPYILNDLVWNLFWNSPEVSTFLCSPDGHYKIYYWPKPLDQHNKKVIFQLTACFIQGGKISTIAEQLNIPIEFVQRFIGACISINNIKKINSWDPHYTPAAQPEGQTEEVGFIKSFFSNLRTKLHL